MSTETADAGYKLQLDGLRCFLFTWIFLVHANLERLWFGTFALPVFFIVSGFLITRNLLAGESASPRRTLGIFYARRALRVFPIYYLICGILVFIGKLAFPVWHFTYLFNVKFFLVSLEGRHLEILGDWTWNGSHFWSLSVEEQFYLTFPPLLILTPKRRRVLLLFALLAASIAARFLLAHLFSGPRPGPVYYGALLPVCGEYILMGAILGYFDVCHGQALRRLPPGLFAYGGIAASLLLFNFAKPPEGFRYFAQFLPVPHQTVYGLAFTAVVWGLWSGDRLLLSRFLSFRPFAYLGKICYGLYLFHMLGFSLWAAFMKRFPDFDAWMTPTAEAFWVADPQWWINGIVPYALTVAMASAAWHLFEGPINGLKRFLPYRSA